MFLRLLSGCKVIQAKVQNSQAIVINTSLNTSFEFKHPEFFKNNDWKDKMDRPGNGMDDGPCQL